AELRDAIALRLPLRPLVDWLDYNGYTVVTKATKEFIDASGRRKVKGNMDIELAVDAMELAEHIDQMVLFSGDGDFRSLVEAVQRRGVRVTVISTIASQPPMIADELRRQGEQMARSLAQWLRNGGCGAPGGAGFTHSVEHLAALRPAPTWPVAFALAAAPSGATASETLLVFAFGWAENAMQAAMKSVPLGQAAAQRVLARLAQAIPQVVDRAIALGDDERQASMPMLAILSAQHELQYSRLFRS
ncbi:MAG TPA: urease accessory UreF family protein, partial [Burkholderiaceae bacterium]|nr:urease accessory UreF family protein [Burkholderiaceae bacterium]